MQSLNAMHRRPCDQCEPSENNEENYRNSVAIVLVFATTIGSEKWFDFRQWHAAKKQGLASAIIYARSRNEWVLCARLHQDATRTPMHKLRKGHQHNAGTSAA
ncbi:MAG: hypothetical protein QM803_10625 [Rhodocyclaceae bacterium]